VCKQGHFVQKCKKSVQDRDTELLASGKVSVGIVERGGRELLLFSDFRQHLQCVSWKACTCSFFSPIK